MSKILVVYHSQTGNTKFAAEAVGRGADSVRGTDVEIKPALKATAQDLLKCDGIAVGSPDYFSYMAGGLKDFFDRAYYPTKGEVAETPCVIFVTHGGGGRAVESVKQMCEKFQFDIIAPPVLVKGRPNEEAQTELEDLGKALAETCARIEGRM